ncbi:MAG: response regulator transcription factor [Bacillota bacterium]|nr:response regulator transcription factor [Bacillota bacterium]
MNSKSKILIVDDDHNICELIRLNLSKEGYDSAIAYDGEAAINKFRTEMPDLVVLDLMLPKIDGMQVCREIRKTSNVPIIMLTAKGEIFDKVLGLELGADDYMVKPFEAKELLARIKAVLRRCEVSESSNSEELIYNDLVINISNYELKIDGKTVEAPPKELELLYFLASHPNRVYTREQLLEEVWGFDYFGDSRTVDVHIKRLREKLGNHEDHWNLKTIWSVGYKFEVKSNES